MGTKHWLTGKVLSSRYPGRTINVYNNVPGQVFQSGDYAFNEPTFADIPNSSDCGPNIVVTLTETLHPYTDIDIQLFDNGALVDTIGVSDARSYYIPPGHTVSAIVVSNNYSTGLTSSIELEFTKNGTSLYDNTLSNPAHGASLTYADPTPLATGDTYTIVGRSSGTNFPQNFTVKADLGVTIVDVKNASSGGTTGVPAGFTGANIVPGNYVSLAAASVTTGHITINTSGFTAGASIALYVDDVEIAVAGMISGVNTYDLLLNTNVTSPTPILIVVKNY